MAALRELYVDLQVSVLAREDGGDAIRLASVISEGGLKLVLGEAGAKLTGLGEMIGAVARDEACRERVGSSRPAWLTDALDEYVEEERGHDEWILDDIAACGGDKDAVRHGAPGHATEVMVAYAYDTIARGNPLGFFGMVHVLEGTSVSLALMAADRIQANLRLPDAAFSYLRSHGTLDQEHTAHFELLMDRLEDRADQDAIVHAARAFYRLYGDVFRSLPLPRAAAGVVQAPARAAA